MNRSAIRAALMRTASALVLALVCLQQAQAQDANASPGPVARRDQNIELAMKIREPFTLVAVGDLLQTFPYSRTNNQDSQFLFNLMRQADVTIGNNEPTIVNPTTFRGPTAHMEAPPTVADDWKNMGVDIVTKANNHTFDAGEEGVWENFRQLDRVGIQYVGVGVNTTEARLARFVETPMGLVGAVGVYPVSDLNRLTAGAPVITVTPAQLAQLRAIRDAIVARRGEVENPIMVPPPDLEGQVSVFGLLFSTAENVAVPSAGPRTDRGTITSKVNVLNLTTYNGVTASQMAQLRAIAGEQGSYSGNTLTAWGKNFRVTPGPGEYHYDMNPQDERDILREVRSGKQFSSFLVVTIHWHQNRFAFQHYSFDHYPADYQIQFAHDCIDQGADAFVGHGVHTIKGVEIYKGKPIFYGLSNFFVTEQVYRSWRDRGAERPPTPLTGPIEGDGELNETQWAWMQQPDNYEALLASSHFEDGKLAEVQIHPVDLGETLNGQGGLARPGSEVGIPRRPSPAKALDMLTRVQQYSNPFRTKISIEDGVGVIRIPASERR